MRRLTVRRNGDNFSRRTGPHLEKSTGLTSGGSALAGPLGLELLQLLYVRAHIGHADSSAGFTAANSCRGQCQARGRSSAQRAAPAPFPRSMVMKSLGGFSPRLRFGSCSSAWSRRDVRLRAVGRRLGAEFVASLAAVLEPLSMEIRTVNRDLHAFLDVNFGNRAAAGRGYRADRFLSLNSMKA